MGRVATDDAVRSQLEHVAELCDRDGRTIAYALTPDEYKRLSKKGYAISDRVGAGGVESEYDAYLRGKDGLSQYRVDAFGHRLTAPVDEVTPSPGEAVRLTLDMKLQRAAEQGLRVGIAAAHASNCVGCWAANGGAIVALDPTDGSILAMAS